MNNKRKFLIGILIFTLGYISGGLTMLIDYKIKGVI